MITRNLKSLLKYPILLLIFFSSILTHAQPIPEQNISRHTAEDRHPVISKKDIVIFESNRSGKWAIYRMNSNGENIHCLICDEFNNRTPSLAFKDNILLFESDRSGMFQLYEFNIKNHSIKKALSVDYIQQFGSYSPNGKYLSFSSRNADDPESWVIWIYDRKKNKLHSPDYLGKRSLYPAWSPDSKKITFFSRKNTDGLTDELYVYELSATSTTRLTQNTVNDFSPTYGPKGKYIYFVKSLDYQTKPEIYKISVKTGLESRLTFNNESDTEPDISSNGKYMVWTGVRNSNYEILITTLK